ncbi:MAG: LysE family transporter [Dehalococcoidales bacterium]|jgi:threonine/homoserine/homoserine lactone efflux protein|nr:LysE family transporter [Dehalococcoidales bacterium]MDD4794231.1 LysE family transporter [Dehalococcoidales bacterium]MDD5498989.1 LysE family transporter [Dehalococcoidales bacterium]
MLPILISAFSISLAAALTPGPVIAVTLAKSYRSSWAGFQVALGGLVAEVPVILLIYFGFARFLQSELIQVILGISGGLMLLLLGIMLFRRRFTAFGHGKDLPVNAFKLGFVTSLVNPGMVIWWATVGALLISQITAYGIYGLLWLIIAIELPNFLWYSTASILFHRYNHLWSSQMQSILIIVFSFVLTGFGAWFIYNAVTTVM